MKFPTYSGGALGGLFRANQFDQSPTPDFSYTKRGTSTIHKQNGFLAITDTTPLGLKMPYLYASTSWITPGKFWHDYVPSREGARPEDTPIGGYIDQQESSPGGFCRNYGVYVGDGYVLELCLPKSSGNRGAGGYVATTLVARLRDIHDTSDDFAAPGASGAASVNLAQTDGSMAITYDDNLDKLAFPSACALGWKNDVERYVFCIFGMEYEIGEHGPHHPHFQAKYFVYVGNTATRTLRRVDLPSLGNDPFPLFHPLYPDAPIHTKSWWGFEHGRIQSNEVGGQASPITAPGPVRCYAVGRGQAMALVVPQERIELGRDADGTAGYTVHPKRLPLGKTPQLLRTRDFGDSWALEDAGFLVADMPPITLKQVQRGQPDADGPGESYYDYSVQPCSFHSGFIAAPMGGGRIAVVAHGKALHPLSASQKEWWPADHVWVEQRRAFRFYISDESGSNFVNKPWPLDHIDADDFLDRNNPSMGEVVSEYVLFNEHRPAFGDYSMGPGNFTIATLRHRRYLQPYPAIVRDYGKYPDDYHITVWSTNDYGDTWVGKPLPKECYPNTDNWRLYRGSGASESAAFLLTYGEFDLTVLTPSRPGTQDNPDGYPPEIAYVRDDGSVESVQGADGAVNAVLRSGDVCITDGDITTMARSVQIPYQSAFSGRGYYSKVESEAFVFQRYPRIGGIYTGDESSPDYPEVVCRPHFEEFEGMTDG